MKQSNYSWMVLVIALGGFGLFGWIGFQLFVVGAKRYV